MKLFTFPQYSDEWFRMRRGVPTVSDFSSIITAVKGDFSAAHKTYIAKLIGDELNSDYPQKDDTATAAMKKGSQLEPQARALYEAWTGETVNEVGFCTTDCGRFGCSPDALVGDVGGLELKCPSPATFAGWVLDGGLPLEHKAQVHGSLLVTGREFWDWMAYLSGQPPLIIRVVPDEFTNRLADCLTKFDKAYESARLRFGLPVSASPLMLGQLLAAV